MILNLVLSLFSTVIDFILGLVGFPDVPAELVSITNTVFDYMQAGMSIINFFCPISVIKPALDVFLLVWIAAHTYKLVMRVLRKIPFFGMS